MPGKVLSSALLGLVAHVVEVEAATTSGLPRVTTVGLPESPVRESKERVRAAIKHSGFTFPGGRVTVNLAPADMPKQGAAYDLPMALAILAATDQLPAQRLRDYVILGELSLDGAVKTIRGALAIAAGLRGGPTRRLIVPAANAAEAAVARDIEVIGVSSLAEARSFLAGDLTLSPAAVDVDALFARSRNHHLDLADVRGQAHAKRALEIAAAGGHHVLLVGPPGSGKTMLAMRLPTILPDLTFPEALEATMIHSVAGVLGSQPLLTARPFRAPHHSISDAGLVGGGSIPHPGELSLAHNGVLFLDELPEFRRNVLELLRQPLESGEIRLARAAATVTYPTRVLLAAAMNSCPCGYSSDPQRPCTCPPGRVQSYRSRISGPLLDRIDLLLEVPPVPYADLSGSAAGPTSSEVRARVSEARALQARRLAPLGARTNAETPAGALRGMCALDPRGKTLLAKAMGRLGLSARAYGRILRVARTIADLAGRDGIAAADVAEALQYRVSTLFEGA